MKKSLKKTTKKELQELIEMAEEEIKEWKSFLKKLKIKVTK